MTPRTHLFAAIASDTWGEVIIALAIADELHARGERVIFLAPQAMAKLFEGKPFQHGWIDPSGARLHQALPQLAAQLGADSVILVDAALVYMHLECLGQCAGFLDRFTVPVIALDVWDLPRSGMEWDFGPNSWYHPPQVLDPAMRLVPAPLALPAPAPGVFAALPDSNRFAGGPELRAQLGISGDDPLVLLPTASWQRPAAQKQPYNQRLAASFPSYLASLLGRANSRVRVVHVGPERFGDLAATLGPRYRWLPQVPPREFASWIAAADLLLSFNLSATSIACAISARLPVLLGINSRAGESTDELLVGIPSPSPELRRWLDHQLPSLHQLYIWPFGFYQFLHPLLESNPYGRCVQMAELLEEEVFVSTFNRLLSPGVDRDTLRHDQAEYAAAVARLPTGANALLEWLR